MTTKAKAIQRDLPAIIRRVQNDMDHERVRKMQMIHHRGTANTGRGNSA